MLPRRGEYMLKDIKRMAKYYQVPVKISEDVFRRILGTSKTLSLAGIFQHSCFKFSLTVKVKMNSLSTASCCICEQDEVCTFLTIKGASGKIQL